MRNFVVFATVTILLCGSIPAPVAYGWGTETLGNKPLVTSNCTDWEGVMPLVNHSTRVYSNWVNGKQTLFYKGTLDDLNASLKIFAAVKVKTHCVLLRPGPGTAWTFDGKRVACDWNLRLRGGISKHRATLDHGEEVWPKDPVLTVYIGGGIELEKLQIPDGVTLTETIAASKRVAAGMAASSDKNVRGWGCSELTDLDCFSDENLKAVAGMLSDKDSWVRSNAIGAMFSFGRKAIPYIPAMRESLASSDNNLKESDAKTIVKIETAPDKSAEEKAYASEQKRIAAFVGRTK